jgi:nicotinamidase-related amidase
MSETVVMSSNIKSRPAVVVVNMLKDMILQRKPFHMPPEFKEQVMPRIAELLENARKMKIQVVYICDAHRPKDPELSDFPAGAEHCVKGTGGEEVINEVKLQPGDYNVVKRRFTGFFGTDLDILLSLLGVGTSLWRILRRRH